MPERERGGYRVPSTRKPSSRTPIHLHSSLTAVQSIGFLWYCAPATLGCSLCDNRRQEPCGLHSGSNVLPTRMLLMFHNTQQDHTVYIPPYTIGFNRQHSGCYQPLCSSGDSVGQRVMSLFKVINCNCCAYCV